ncbi:C-C chemokine receptor type 2-like [Mercenaria mercenaria]|uniref:C-C chemokine receptor type 2-like n=1 Tax=Mercenaria mercenaria TaxID=6596 RepID=UPI00234EE908|nr:C-C chemokine receptor type 2-like [Mercenaria mercenaria]
MDVTTVVDINGTTSELLQDENYIYDKYLPVINSSSKYMRLLVYALGYPGNLLAFLVWIRKPMLQSSGVYLATLALSDLLFLLLDLPYSLQTEWNVFVLNLPVICEGFTVVYLAAQYMSPLLTLAFTTERYIAIKFPLKRRMYCTVRRALCMSSCIALTSLGLCGIQGYFWKYDVVHKACLRRMGDYTQGLWETWTWVTEMIMFLCVPLIILILNLLVIFEIRKSRKVALKLNRILFKTNATTTMLLAVSFFLIITTLPVSVMYALYDSFPPGDSVIDIETNEKWQIHFQYYRARTVIYNIGLTHFFMNFYIYLMAGERFRREVMNAIRCRSSRRGLSKQRLETTKMESFYSSDAI